jgi:glycosyltransferase involved in cell wall biosynthesis
MNWIVSELFFPDEVSTAKIFTDIAIKKADGGQVSVICGPIGYEKSYQIQDNNNLDKRIKVYRISLPSLNKNKIVQRIIKLVSLTFKMSWSILVEVKKDDNVLITTNPSFLIIAIAALKKLKSFNLEILVHDVFPENLVAAGLVKKDSLKYKFLNKVFNWSYKKSDRIIALGEDMKTLLKEKTWPKCMRIDVIPNWSDSEIHPIQDFNISEYLGIDVSGKIVLGFAGNLGRVQGILEFIDLFTRSENPKIIIIIIGDGALASLIKDKIKNLPNVYYLGPKGRNDQNYFLNACHIGLVTLIGGMKGLGVPSKTYNLMAAAKPLLYVGDKNSEIDNYVRIFECGWSVSWENEAEIILLLKSFSPDVLPDIHEKGLKSRIASGYFNKSNLLNLF